MEEDDDGYPIDTPMQDYLASDAAWEEVDKTASDAHHAKYGPPEAPQLPVKLYGYAEMALKHSVPNKIPPLTLGGRADYAISYTSFEPTPESVLIVAEAKGLSKADEGAFWQLVTYMATVRASRLAVQRQHATITGFVTDGHSFIFAKLNKSGLLTKSRKLEWHMEDNDIFSFIVSTFRLAILQTPTTSPYLNDPEHLEEHLGTFDLNETRVFSLE